MKVIIELDNEGWKELEQYLLNHECEIAEERFDNWKLKALFLSAIDREPVFG